MFERRRVRSKSRRYVPLDAGLYMFERLYWIFHVFLIYTGKYRWLVTALGCYFLGTSQAGAKLGCHDFRDLSRNRSIQEPSPLGHVAVDLADDCHALAV